MRKLIDIKPSDVHWIEAREKPDEPCEDLELLIARFNYRTGKYYDHRILEDGEWTLDEGPQWCHGGEYIEQGAVWTVLAWRSSR